MKKTQIIENKTSWNKVGFILSLMCAIHCAAVPLLVLILPALSAELLHNPLIELGLVVFGAVVAGGMLTKDFLHIHKHVLPLLLLLGGFIIQLTGIYAVGHANMHIVLMIGSGLVATAYFANWKLKASYNATCKC